MIVFSKPIKLETGKMEVYKMTTFLAVTLREEGLRFSVNLMFNQEDIKAKQFPVSPPF